MTFASDLNDGVDDQLAEAGETITITRAGITDDSQGIPEQAGRPVDVGESRVAGSDRQFVIRVADYHVNGLETLPRVGDRITWNNTRFEVQPIVNGVDHYELYGSRGYAYRVYTSEVGPAN